jgi:hypothetical protein
MITRPPLSNAKDSPLLSGEGLGVRSVTMFAAGVGTLEDLQAGKLVGESKDV